MDYGFSLPTRGPLANPGGIPARRRPAAFEPDEEPIRNLLTC